jgi:hypothetical protein
MQVCATLRTLLIDSFRARSARRRTGRKTTGRATSASASTMVRAAFVKISGRFRSTFNFWNFLSSAGASGVVVDGEVGSTSVLRYLNHSCEPNAEMKFIWLSNGKRRMPFIELFTFDHQNRA